MSLVYAQRTGNIVYFLADTFSEITRTGVTCNWFAEPLIKIIQRGDFVFAYAGNSYIAIQTIGAISSNGLDPAISTLCASSSSGQVDYAVCHIPSKRLLFIKEGSAGESSTGYLGSKQGFENFQRHRCAGSDDNQTQMHIVRLVNQINQEENASYTRSLSAFRTALIDTDGTFGGIAIPYVISDEICAYGTYTSVYRGQLREAEMPISEYGDVPHQDMYRGGYCVEVWGSKSALAVYLTGAMTGHIFSSSSETFPSHRSITQVDGYDFSDVANAAGCGEQGISTWKNWQNAARNARKSLIGRDFDKAQKRLAHMEEEVVATLNGMNSNLPKKIAVNDNLISELRAARAITLSVDVINCISVLLELRHEVQNASGDAQKHDFCLQQLVTWRALVERLAIKLDFQ
jgi:hypothetical protein